MSAEIKEMGKLNRIKKGTENLAPEGRPEAEAFRDLTRAHHAAAMYLEQPAIVITALSMQERIDLSIAISLQRIADALEDKS